MKIPALPGALVLLLAAATSSAAARPADLTFAERVDCERALRRVYHSHVLGTDRAFEEAVPEEVLEARVLDSLRRSAALEQIWSTPITDPALRRELLRMERGSRMPGRLEELRAVLGDDPVLVLECLVRPALADRMIRGSFARDRSVAREAEALPDGIGPPPGRGSVARRDWSGWWAQTAPLLNPLDVPTVASDAPLEEALGTGCTEPGAWEEILPQASTPDGRKDHAAVWTGTHMMIWGGRSYLDTPLADGALYDPALDQWTPMPPVPFIGFHDGRRNPTAIWTGDRMIVWGGLSVIETQVTYSDGFSFDPVSGRIDAIATSGQPTPRGNHTAVWTGQEMIVYGGERFVGALDPAPISTPGGVYEPATDTWRLLPTAGEPASRLHHSAVWTGTRMLIWGGEDAAGYLESGAAYSPSLDDWVAIPSTGAPGGLERHSAVWTGNEMIVWGYSSTPTPPYVIPVGGRFSPSTGAWLPISTTQAPALAWDAPAVWTGTEMIVWWSANSTVNGRYDPVSDSWLPVPSQGAPAGAGGGDHTAVWTGDAMLVWGGEAPQTGTGLYSNRGGLFDPDGVTPLDGDGDGVTACDGDCDDTNPDVYPGAPQICDGVNNNCLHPGWPSLAGLGEVDMDQDGFRVCDADCDDTDPVIYPGAPQACDGINNDCLSPQWPSLAGLGEEDRDGDGFFTCEGDCDDGEPSAYPGNTEACDLVDNNCDGATDEGLVRAAGVVHPSSLGLSSRGRFFSIQVQVFDSCNPEEGRRLHGREIERTWVSRVGRTILPDPLSRPCPNNGQYGFERGLVESIPARTVTSLGAILRFQDPWDGDCRTLGGDRDSLDLLIASEKVDTPIPLCVAGIARGAAFEACSEVFRRGRQSFHSMAHPRTSPPRRGQGPSIPPEDPSP